MNLVILALGKPVVSLLAGAVFVVAPVRVNEARVHAEEARAQVDAIQTELELLEGRKAPAPPREEEAPAPAAPENAEEQTQPEQ